MGGRNFYRQFIDFELGVQAERREAPRLEFKIKESQDSQLRGIV